MTAGGQQLRVAYDASQLLHNHSAWSFVPWRFLRKIKNRSLRKQAKYRSEKSAVGERKREALEETSEQFDVKYLLGIMNSSVAREWLRSRRRSNIHLYPDDWKPLPIPVVDSATQASIAKLVEQILITRRASPSADIAVLENAIDVRVKEAFGIQ